MNPSTYFMPKQTFTANIYHEHNLIQLLLRSTKTNLQCDDWQLSMRQSRWSDCGSDLLALTDKPFLMNDWQPVGCMLIVIYRQLMVWLEIHR